MTLAEERAGRIGHGVPLPRQAPWPRQSPLPEGVANALPVPALSVFEIKEGLRAATRGISRRADQGSTADHEALSVAGTNSSRAIRGKSQPGGVRPAAGHGTPNAARARRGTLKHLVQVRKRSV